MSATMADIDDFLNSCKPSGDAAYTSLKSLLDRLQSPATRSAARVFLAELQRKFASKDDGERCFNTYHFRIHDVVLSSFHGNQKRKKLTMMEIPSIFIPEDWSFTFYEGLNRLPDSMFKDRIVTELGCGNGWISIALADKWLPSKVYGLDINPRAVKVAWINLFLNALDENGDPIHDEEGKTLLDRVEFHESDLLAYCKENKIKLDRIVGCIPQILNPNPEAMSKIITENASEEFLYSLSNYCALQGFVEDQFGLGLIARAVEEGIEVIKPMGIMIFNIGGRPGQGVCNRLFERRGLRTTKLWQTKIMQAADTDISALVEIEKNSHHRFEFFMGLAGDQPICARTALAYAKCGGRISHALSVYSCKIRQPNQVKIIFDFLKNGFQEVSSSLDLSFDDDAIADEKIPFLAFLASTFKEISFLPYEPPAGCLRFRNLIAGFMKTYHHIPLSENNVTVFPSRTVAIENVLRLFHPQLALVDEHLTRNLPKHWLTYLANEETNNGPVDNVVTVIEAPRQSDLMIELIKKQKPQVVVTGIADFEAITSSAFENLLNTTREIGSRLFVDVSDQFELSSLPGSNGVLKYLAEKTLPSHAAILCGLVKNRVYSDLEAAFVISEDEKFCSTLSKTVEVLQGYTSLFTQYYYACVFHELLAFQLADRRPPVKRESAAPEPAEMTRFANSAISALNDAELSVPDKNDSSFIHMDVDQSFLPIPTAVKASIFESYARQNMSEAETYVDSEIRQLVNKNYGFPSDSVTDIVFDNSHLALFNKLVLCCIQEKGTIFFPSGTNGNYVSAAKFMKANTVKIATHPESGFKLVAKELAGFFGTVERPWLYISGPTVNPTGALYSNEEIKEILSVCAKAGAKVVIDTSFSGLEFQTNDNYKWDLRSHISTLKSVSSSFCVSLLGGLSFELLTGGLDFGYVILNDSHLIEEFHKFPSLSKPHITVKYAIKKLLGGKDEAHNFSDAIKMHKDTLNARSEILTKTLGGCGWDVISCSSGASLVAKPTTYLGKTLKLDSFEARLDDTNFREAVRKATGLCINSGLWTGIPNYCRFSFALESSEFERALHCITKFKKLVLGS